MHHFFVDRTDIDTEARLVRLTGENYRHLRQVLRAKPGEKVLISDGEGTDYECTVSEVHDADGCAEAEMSAEEVLLHIDFVEEMHELPADIYLFQGLPKQDKMELIVQKAVELGAHAVIPLETKNTVVKLDEKRAAKKVERWQAIAEAAAKQSKRSIIPEVMPVMSFKEAVAFAKTLDIRLMPYELAENMAYTREVLAKIEPGQSIGIFIGPEGGFAEEEVELALNSQMETITLGKRILRTETAGMTVLSILMYLLEP